MADRSEIDRILAENYGQGFQSPALSNFQADPQNELGTQVATPDAAALMARMYSGVPGMLRGWADNVRGAVQPWTRTHSTRLGPRTESAGPNDNILAGGLDSAANWINGTPRVGADTLAPLGAAAVGGLGLGLFGRSMPQNTLFSFIGRPHAENLLQREGNPIPLRAIDMATEMEARGAPDRQIHTEVNRYIQQNDPTLGPIYRPAESSIGGRPNWMVELPNNETMAMARMPAERATLNDVLLDPRIYRASPESERMPVLSGSAADRAAGRDGLPPMDDSAAARYIPRAEGGHGRIEMGTDVHNSRKVLLEELQHHLDREAGLSSGSSPAFERSQLLASGEWLNNPAMTQLQSRMQHGDSAARGSLNSLLDDAAFERYRRNAAETRATLVRERSEMSPAALHRYLPEVNEALINPRSRQHVGSDYTPVPHGGRPVASDEVVRFLESAGAQNVRLKVAGRNSTEYIKFDPPDNPWQHGHSQARPTVRVPTDAARHGGRPPRDSEVGNLFDTSPRPNLAAVNESGGRFSQWENLVAALKWRLSAAPDGQWLISPNQAPIGRVPGSLTPRPPPMAPDPRQGTLRLFESNHGGFPAPPPNLMGGRAPIYSHPAIHSLIVNGHRAGQSNADIVRAIRERTGVLVQQGDVGAYIRRLDAGE